MDIFLLKEKCNKYSEVFAMEQEKIGKLIAAKRKEKGLTQEQLAEQLGVTNKTVSRWETGKGMPDIEMIQELCSILGITVTTLLNGEESDEEALVIKLLWMIEQLKQLYLVVLGLVICNVPGVLDDVILIKEVIEGTGFWSGVVSGSFAGIRIVGVVVFVYGLARYAQKNKGN